MTSETEVTDKIDLIETTSTTEEISVGKTDTSVCQVFATKWVMDEKKSKKEETANLPLNFVDQYIFGKFCKILEFLLIFMTHLHLE